MVWFTGCAEMEGCVLMIALPFVQVEKITCPPSVLYSQLPSVWVSQVSGLVPGILLNFNSISASPLAIVAAEVFNQVRKTLSPAALALK